MTQTAVEKRLHQADKTLKEWRWAIQRMKRGYSDCDSWDACSYLCDVIPGLLDSQTHRSGWPGYIDGPEEWQEILRSIRTGFRAAHSLMDEYPTGEQRERLEAEWKKGSKLFTKHFFALWD